MAEQITGPVMPLELLAIAAGAPPEIAGRIRLAADQLAALYPDSGAGRIYAERRRQVREEGFGTEADDSYKSEQLARAAACYALPYADERRLDALPTYGVPKGWPWPQVAWKSGRPVSDGEGDIAMPIEDRIRELEKSGALCAAEIDRLLRLQAAGETVV